MKIEKEKFWTGTFVSSMIAKEIGMATSIAGLAMFGSATTMVTLGFGNKHPFIAGLVSGVLGSMASTTILCDDRLQNMICESASEDADKLTTIFYDSEELTED